jgi:antirestriction protein ArdC
MTKKQQLLTEKKQRKELYTQDELDAVTTQIAWLRTMGYTVSPFSFLDVLKVMEAKGLEGVPFADTKTFHGWREQGRKVKKGEKAIYQSVSWNKIENIKEHKDGTIEVTDEFKRGKVYSLFHRSQTEEIKSKSKQVVDND